MAKLLKLRRGTTSQHSSFTGAEGECTVDTDKETLVVHDGSTAGGHPVAAEDMANVSSASIAGRLANDSIATSKIAAGALPSDVTVANANVTASAAIAGTKISPDFGSQNIESTGNATVGRLKIEGSNVPKIEFTDSDDNPDYSINVNDGRFNITDETNSANRFKINTDGHIDISGNVDFAAGIDVTGNIIATGNIDADSDSGRLSVGADGDLHITHNGSAGQIDNDTGDLTIQTQNAMNLKTADAEFGIQLVKHGGVTLYHDDAGPKAQTTSTGFDVTGTLDVDEVNITTSTAGSQKTLKLNNTNASAGTNEITFSSTTSGTNFEAASIRNGVPNTGNGSLQFKTNNGSGLQSAVVINNDQTTTFNAAIDVTGDVTTTGNIILDSNSNKLKIGDGQELLITHNGSQSIITDTAHPVFLKGNQVHLQSANGNMISCYQDAQVELFHNENKRLETTTSGVTVTSNLNCGNLFATSAIGLDSTDYLQFTDNTRMDITINGNNEFRFEADGDFHADGDVIAQSTTISSDRKLKENIEVIPNALDKVQALNGVSFDWKKTGEKSAGVIAQEVQEVLPEAVKEVTPVGGGDSHLAVNYHALTSILIESIKELKAEIEELKGGK